MLTGKVEDVALVKQRHCDSGNIFVTRHKRPNWTDVRVRQLGPHVLGGRKYLSGIYYQYAQRDGNNGSTYGYNILPDAVVHGGGPYSFDSDVFL